MFGRQVAARIRIPHQTRLAQGTPFLCQNPLTIRIVVAEPKRSYATPSRPKKAVGEPSRTVKRAVKRAAVKPTTDDEPAAKKNKAKKAAAESKTKTAAVKSAKSKPAPKAKLLTDEQQAAQKQKLAKAELKELKQAALSPPSIKKSSAWVAFYVPKIAESRDDFQGANMQRTQALLAEKVKAIAAEYRALAPADIEHLNHLANTAKEEANAKFKHWVESHTVEEIAVANRARHILRKRETVEFYKQKKWPAISDERAPKRPSNAYLQFLINRHASGDFKNIAATDRLRLVGQEWKALNEEEKKKYQNLFAEDKERYDSEYSEVIGHAPPHTNVAQQPQAAAAAA